MIFKLSFKCVLVADRLGNLMVYLSIDLGFWFWVMTREKVAANSVGGTTEM